MFQKLHNINDEEDIFQELKGNHVDDIMRHSTFHVRIEVKQTPYIRSRLFVQNTNSYNVLLLQVLSRAMTT